MPKRRGRRTKALQELLAERIRGCEQCLASYSHETLEEITRRLKLTRLEEARLLRSFTCPGCDLELDEYDRVAAYDPRQLRELRRMQQWTDRFATRIGHFQHFVTLFPTLGALHPIGIRLAEAVGRSSAMTLAANQVWYRASRTQMEPRLDYLHETGARFHGPGQHAMYLADDPPGAVVEVFREDPTLEGEVWIDEIVFGGPLRVLDLTAPIIGEANVLPLLVEGLRGTVRALGTMGPASPEYHITRYIADLVRRRKLDGLIHTSSRPHPFSAPFFSRNLLIVHEVPFAIDHHDWHRWKRSAGSLGLPSMELDPPVPESWWERLKRR